MRASESSDKYTHEFVRHAAVGVLGVYGYNSTRAKQLQRKNNITAVLTGRDGQ